MLDYKNKAVNFTKMIVLILVLTQFTACQTYKIKSDGYPYITDSESFYKYAESLPLGIKNNDDRKTVLAKINKYLDNFKPVKPDDKYSIAANKEALDGCITGGYGIGAVLVDPDGKIVEQGYNSMVQERRSDLHAEMDVMTKFESDPANDKYRKGYCMKPGFTLYSSAEPCPMCMIRLATAKVDCKYNCKNDTDSITRQLDGFPEFWKNVCEKRKFEQADCSKVLSDIAYLLFYSYFLKGEKKLRVL